jgi:hypothetical protein
VAIRITVELSEEAPYQSDRVANPDRVFFDFSNATIAPAVVDQIKKVNTPLIKTVRVGSPTKGVTRVVMELNGSPRQSAFLLYNPFRPGDRCGGDDRSGAANDAGRASAHDHADANTHIHACAYSHTDAQAHATRDIKGRSGILRRSGHRRPDSHSRPRPRQRRRRRIPRHPRSPHRARRRASTRWLVSSACVSRRS